MAAISSHFSPKGRNTNIVQIFSYEDKCLEGVLQCMSLGEEHSFSNLMQFLILMDAVMDMDNQPQRSVEPRTFDQPMSGVPVGTHRARRKTPPIATFQINVLFRQNASWQGSVLWVDKGMESRFRSALELISLLDNALSVSLEKAGK